MTVTINKDTKLTLFTAVTCTIFIIGVVIKIIFWAAEVEANAKKGPIALRGAELLNERMIRMETRLGTLPDNERQNPRKIANDEVNRE